ncbi:hypothetical protein BLNAU_18322 [Blattamonas nauphoetae]|uniref:Uncharacterized protein n=1 Tax=Blattamonas nauphoetae TaxID=2049346 RepID=A0ABQ9X4M8_9EUKA|nr:hypothetical protein BLNAU_18322 [Blattamonas nauphoetae]
MVHLIAFSPHTLVTQSVYVPKHTAYSDFAAVDPLSINHPSHKIRNRDDPLNPVYPAEPATTCPPAHLPPPEPPQPQPVFHPIEPSGPPAEESETLVIEPSAPTAEEEATHEMTEAKKDAVFSFKQPAIVDVPHKTITMDAPLVQPTRIVLPSAPTEEEEKQADEDVHQPREDAESIEEGRHAQEHRKRGLSRASSSFPLTRPEEENERRLALDDVVKYAEQRWDEREGSAKSAVQQLIQMELLQNDREEQMPKIDEDLTEQYEKDLRAMKDPFDRALREQDEREAELDLLAEEGHDLKQTYQEQIQETVDLIRHEKEEVLKAMAEWREEKEKERGRIDESGRNEIRRLSEAVDALREDLGSLQYQIQILKEEKAKLQETRPKSSRGPVPRTSSTFDKTRAAPFTDRNGECWTNCGVHDDVESWRGVGRHVDVRTSGRRTMEVDEM